MDRFKFACEVIRPKFWSVGFTVGPIELRAVEQIEGFGAELEADALDDGDVLDHREVHVVDASGAEVVEAAGQDTPVAVQLLRSYGIEGCTVEGVGDVAGIPVQVAAEVDGAVVGPVHRGP